VKTLTKGLVAAAAIGTACAGVYLSQKYYQGGTDLVTESPAAWRLTSRAPAPPSHALAIHAFPGDYLEPMAEPTASPKASGANRAPSSISLAQPSAPQAPVPAALASAEGGGECAAGARPLGECNCYDESAGKLSLHLHPSQACVLEESVRLGHQVVVKNESGGLELAGVQAVHPEAQHADAAAAAPALPPAPLAIPQLDPPLFSAQGETPDQDAAERASFGFLLRASARASAQPAAASAAPASVPAPAFAFTGGAPGAAPAPLPPARGGPPPSLSSRPAPPTPPAPMALLAMSRCTIGGHDVHILIVGSGTLLHIRRGAPLSAPLLRAQNLILGGTTTGVVITQSALSYWLANGTGKDEPLSSPQSTALAGIPGYDDTATALAYAASLNGQSPPVASNPPSSPVQGKPPAPVSSPVLGGGGQPPPAIQHPPIRVVATLPAPVAPGGGSTPTSGSAPVGKLPGSGGSGPVKAHIISAARGD
jgi:hypothetical protein